MNLANHQYRLAARPMGMPKRSDWNYAEEPVRDPDVVRLGRRQRTQGHTECRHQPQDQDRTAPRGQVGHGHGSFRWTASAA